jgi:hypothetical protein
MGTALRMYLINRDGLTWYSHIHAEYPDVRGDGGGSWDPVFGEGDYVRVVIGCFFDVFYCFVGGGL